MPSDGIKVTLSRQFLSDMNTLGKAFKLWQKNSHVELRKKFRIIGVLVKGQAQRRVPVETNRLKQQIISVVDVEEDGVLSVEVGTNVRSESGFPYPIVLEFGSKHIAGGQVQALGEGVDITDAEAITDWPAKTKRQATGQQMPWLRPAWNEVLPEAIGLITGSMVPPKQK